MKKWLLLALVMALIGGVWYYMRTYVRYTPESAKPKFGKITRGDIRVPISASGLIEANKQIIIKSKASGEVIKIAVAPGDYVKKGDTLVVLKKDDEQRRLVQAQAGLTRVKALLAQAKVAVERARENILSAQAHVDELKHNAEVIDVDLDWNEKHPSSSNVKAIKVLRLRRQIADAQIRSAEASVEIAKAALKDAQQNVVIQHAAVEEATKQVEDAQERLSETTIVAPQNAIVTEVRVTEGMLVQSATQGFTGGTPVMTLADVSKLKVLARVDESDIGRVLDISPVDALPELPGLRDAVREDKAALEQRSGIVTLTVDAFPEETFEGRIERVEPQGQLNTGAAVIQFNVHVIVTDKNRSKLPLGTQAQVEFTVESATNALLVPAEAVMTYQDERGIWVKTPPPPGSREAFGKKFLPCQFGITDGDKTQLVRTLGGNPMPKEGVEVFTRLPQVKKRGHP